MGKKINLTGQRFGFWMVLKEGGKTKNGHTQWLCRCECGVQKLVTTNSLRTSNSTSCGCNHAPDLVGQQFGYLTVQSKDNSKSKGRRYWICHCKCGKTVSVSTYYLRNNIATSCGCLTDPLFNKCHVEDCHCNNHTMGIEDFPSPNAFYSPQHLEKLSKFQIRKLDFQRRMEKIFNSNKISLIRQ